MRKGASDRARKLSKTLWTEVDILTDMPYLLTPKMAVYLGVLELLFSYWKRVKQGCQAACMRAYDAGRTSVRTSTLVCAQCWGRSYEQAF